MAKSPRQELQELEELDRLESRAAAHPVPAKPDASAVDKFVGFPVTRAALGPPTAAMGLAQMGGKAIGLDTKTLDEKLADIEASKRRGMDYWAKQTGIFAPSDAPDWMGIAGTAALGSPAASKLPEAASTIGKIAQGAGLGAGFGVATPTEAGPQYWKDKAAQAAIGGVTGGAIPALTEAKSFVMPSKNDINAMVMNYLKKITGKDRLPEVVDALKSAQPSLKGGVSSAAHALKDVPGGSPIVAHQGVIASTPGGPSARFIEASKKNTGALDAFEKASRTEINALKTQALDAVNKNGGVPTDRLFQQIAALPSLKHATSEEADFILKHLTDQVGNAKAISAETLYALRDKFASKFDGELSRELRTTIDDVMEQSGGTGWKAFMSKYPEMLKTVKEAKAGERNLYKTPTKLGGESSKQEQIAKLPHLIEHDTLNTILTALRGDITPRLQSRFTDLYLNPRELADALEALQVTPQLSAAQAAGTIAIPRAIIEPRKDTRHARADRS